MSEVKYEPIFGDQSLFDGAPEDAEAVFKNQMRETRCAYYRLSHGHERYISGEWVKVPSVDSQTFSAMRRIIADPKRWTQADKDAGRLPEVGAKCKDRSFLFKVINVTDKYVVIETMQSGDVYSLTHHSFMSSCDPIETPAEKAQREEDELIRSLAGTDIHYGTGTVKELFDQGARAAYRKMKGGE